MAREIDESTTSAWKRFSQFNTFLRDQKMPMCLKKDHGHHHTTINDIWSRDLVPYQPPEGQAGLHSEKCGESNTGRHKEIRSAAKTQRARTRVKDVIQKAFEAKGKWAGHIVLMKNNEWAKKRTEWTPMDRKRAKEDPK